MKKIKIKDYIIKNLVSLKIEHFFGLAGDYNFKLLEAVENNKLAKWIGSTNELNASYAADGYARIRGFACCITTFGVGELCALNGICGAFAENVPLFMLVGAPNWQDIQQKKLLHHNFVNPNYFAFSKMFALGTRHACFLDKNIDLKLQIDKCLNIFINEKQPVYLAVPKDLADCMIDDNFYFEKKKSNQNNLRLAISKISNLIKSSSKPILVFDCIIERLKLEEKFSKFLQKTNLPYCTLTMGQGMIREGNENYLGNYLGNFENKNLLSYLKTADCIVLVGTILSDFNTFSFSFDFEKKSKISIEKNLTKVESEVFENILMSDIVDALLQKNDLKFEKTIVRKNETKKTKPLYIEKSLNAEYIFEKLENFLSKDDIIFSETGVSMFAVAKFKKNIRVQNQSLWASIGWATAACFGGSIADINKRFILITGEGAHQLTASEISNMIRHNLKPIIFVINNNGYTIERLLSSNPNREYNDIAFWNYSKLPYVFSDKVFSAQAKTNFEFDAILKKLKTENKTKICYIELFTAKTDAVKLAYQTLKQIRKAEK